MEGLRWEGFEAFWFTNLGFTGSYCFFWTTRSGQGLYFLQVSVICDNQVKQELVFYFVNLH
ncbi:hypothetical protein YC2023_117690 [Brassica napus]